MNKKITFPEALLTAIGMVIGSGIYFRADNILKLSEGNVAVAIIGWLAFGLATAFAGIAVSVIAERTDKEGGMVGYIEEVFGKTASFIAGWFCTFAYIPPMTGILSIVASTYIWQIAGNTSPSVAQHFGLAGALIVVIFIWNYFSTKFAALFSSFATIVKLFPLVLIGFVGLTKFNVDVVSGGMSTFTMGAFTGPLLSMAFAFDGWTNAATLSKDMVNPRRDTARVLALNAIIVMVIYILYFTGVTMLLPAEEIIKADDAHVGIIANNIFGDYGEKFVLFCVVMSVLGTLNGNIMTGYRYPHALAQANNLPKSEFFVKKSKYGTNGRAAIIFFGAAAAWFTMYASQAFFKAQAVAQHGAEAVESKTVRYTFDGITFDDIPIMAFAFVIITTLVGSMIIAKRDNVGMFKGIIAPIIGIIGQVYIVISFIKGNPQWLTYMIVVLVIVLIGYLIRRSLPYHKKA